MELRRPYLLFLGDAEDDLAAKTARGILDWRPEWCLGQVRLPGCRADLKLPDMRPAEAARSGAGTLVVGVANSGGVLPDHWLDTLVEAAEQGMDIASGLHRRLGSFPALADVANRKGIRLVDARYSDGVFETGTGKRRLGLRLLTVGTDCSIGKKYAALAMERAMRARGLKADFRATGQTGIFISGRGVAIDAVVADFISGAAEWIAPANEPDHWDIVEGQGSLFHPAFAGVTLGLLHGAQPDAFVVCHEPGRKTMRSVEHPLPSIREVLDFTVKAGSLTNPGIRCIGIAVNTSAMDEEAANACIRDLAREFGVPTADPMRHGVESLVDELVARFPT